MASQADIRKTTSKSELGTAASVPNTISREVVSNGIDVEDNASVGAHNTAEVNDYELKIGGEDLVDVIAVGSSTTMPPQSLQNESRNTGVLIENRKGGVDEREGAITEISAGDQGEKSATTVSLYDDVRFSPEQGGGGPSRRKAWESLGSELEIEAENAAGATRRAPLEMQFTIDRQTLLNNRSKALVFINKDASEDSRDLRSVPNALYKVLRDEVEAGVQAVPETTNRPTQTPFFRKVEACIQAEPTVVDARVVHGEEPATIEPGLRVFLNKALPQTLHCLTLNEEVPIYTDDFAAFAEDDALVTSRDDVGLAERGNYAHALTRGRCIGAVDWRSPRPRDEMIAIATVPNCPLEETLQARRSCRPSTSVIWELSDPMHPRFFLEAPTEVCVLRFNPTKPNLIAGGAANGQVLLWDLDRAAVAAKSGASKSRNSGIGTVRGAASTRSGGGNVTALSPAPERVTGVSFLMDGDIQVPLLQPIQVSQIEHAHRRGVHDIQWLPDGLEIGLDNQQVITQSGTQFASISDDGSICIWDIRREHLPLDKLRKMKHQGKVGGDDIPWVPLHRYPLVHPDGSGELMGFRLFLRGVTHLGAPSNVIACATTTGELVMCSTASKNDRNTPSPLGTVPTGSYGSTKDAKIVRMAVQAHAGCVHIVQGNPQIGDVFLTCGDYTFKIWRLMLPHPIIVSARFPALITCAKWSPTRPAIVFIGTGDGRVQAWDLLDRRHEPIFTHQLSQEAITCIEFKPVTERQRRGSYGINHRTGKSKMQQELIVGTRQGTFHWYSLPVTLVRAHSSERLQMRAMLEREVRRVMYFLWRWAEREKELDRYGVNAPKIDHTALARRVVSVTFNNDAAGSDNKSKSKKGGGGAVAASAMTLDGEAERVHYYSHNPQRDADFLELVEQLHQQDVEDLEIQE